MGWYFLPPDSSSSPAELSESRTWPCLTGSPPATSWELLFLPPPECVSIEDSRSLLSGRLGMAPCITRCGHKHTYVCFFCKKKKNENDLFSWRAKKPSYVTWYCSFLFHPATPLSWFQNSDPAIRCQGNKIPPRTTALVID